MTITTANLDITTDTFGTWVAKTNSLAYNMTTHVVTVDGTATGNTSTGNGTIIGRFGANTLFATAALRGGNVSSTDTLIISSNLTVSNTATISGALVLSNTINVTGVATFNSAVTNTVTSNTITVGGASINSTSIAITSGVGTIAAVANSSVARIVVGNSIVNSTYVSSNNGYFTGNLVVDGVFTTTSDLSVAGDLIPPVTNTYDLGNTISTFRNGYFTLIDVTNLDASNSVTIGTTVVNSTVLQSSSLFTVNTTSNTVGAARFSNTVTILGNTAANTLSAAGVTTISNTLNVTGLTTANDINAATANTTAINVGANVNITTASITFGNSSVNTFANSTTLDIDGTLAVLNSVSFSNTFNVTGLSTLGAVNATTANATGINVGANVNITTAQIKVGNTTANVTVSNSTININGATINSTAYSGAANNATFLATQPAAYYTNATNLVTGTVPTARLGSGTADATTFLRGDQSYSTAVTSVSSGAGLTGTVTTTGSLAVNANNGIVSNTSGTFVDAKTGLVANTTGLHVLANTGIVANATGTYVNATYISTISSNNASFLGGTAAASYALKADTTFIGTTSVALNRASGLQTLTGVSIDGTANNATNLNGQAASFYTDIAARLGYTPLNNTSGVMFGQPQIQSTSPTLQFNDTNSGNRYVHCNDGFIGFLNSSFGWSSRVDDSGNWQSWGNITAYASDNRLKTNIRVVSETPLQDLLKLNGVRFDWREDTDQPMRGTDVGLIAQEVEEVIPEAIAPAPFDNTYKTIKMNQQITALIVEAVKELTSEVNELRAKVAELESKDL